MHSTSGFHVKVFLVVENAVKTPMGRKRMVELPYWETDKNLNNVRMLGDFKDVLKKYFNKDILAKYPNLFGGF